MRKIIGIVLALLILFSFSTSSAEDEKLYAAKSENGYWGYINDQGDWIIAPTYDSAMDFRGNYGIVSHDEQTILIDRNEQAITTWTEDFYLDNGYDGFYYGGRDTGIILVDDYSMVDEDGWNTPNSGFIDVPSGFFSGICYGAVYPWCSADSKLIAVADAETGLWGYADRTNGEIVISCQYWGFDPGTFSGGVVAVAYEDEKGNPTDFFLIDESGNTIDLPEGITVNIYANAQEGLIKVKAGDLYGYANAQGEIVIVPAYCAADSFSNGWAKVQFPEGDWGRIDRKGNVLVRGIQASPTFDEKGMFVLGQEGSYTLYDENAQAVFTLSMEKLVSLNTPDENGICSFATDISGNARYWKDRRYGMVGTDGVIICEAQYNYSDFQQSLVSDCGLKPAKRNDTKWGYIDAYGRPVIDFIYDDANGFDGNLATVTLYGDEDSDTYTVAYINPEGSIVCSWQETW